MKQINGKDQVLMYCDTIWYRLIVEIEWDIHLIYRFYSISAVKLY